MKLIYKVTDKDIGEIPVEMKNPRTRLGARGIVVREDGKIAVFNKANKNEYKLPGGGIEGKEEPKEAFKREVLEETGCEVEIIETIGTIEEIAPFFADVVAKPENPVADAFLPVRAPPSEDDANVPFRSISRVVQKTRAPFSSNVAPSTTLPCAASNASRRASKNSTFQSSTQDASASAALGVRRPPDAKNSVYASSADSSSPRNSTKIRFEFFAISIRATRPSTQSAVSVCANGSTASAFFSRVKKHFRPRTHPVSATNRRAPTIANAKPTLRRETRKVGATAKIAFFSLAFAPVFSLESASFLSRFVIINYIRFQGSFLVAVERVFAFSKRAAPRYRNARRSSREVFNASRRSPFRQFAHSSQFARFALFSSVSRRSQNTQSLYFRPSLRPERFSRFGEKKDAPPSRPLAKKNRRVIMKVAVERKRPFRPFAVDSSPFRKSTRERYSSFQRVFKTDVSPRFPNRENVRVP